MEVDVTISIVNWNNRNYLRDCLRSIKDNVRGIGYEVIAADNASFDGSAAMAREMFPEVNLIENQRNVGYAKANNQIYAVAKGRNFLLLNPDTLIARDALERMCEFLDTHPRAGAVAPKYLNPDGTFQYYYQRLPIFTHMVFKLTYLNYIFPNNRFVRSYYMLDGKFDNVMELEQPAASCLMVKKQIFKDYLFDERFPLLWNDVDLCKRIHDAGYTIYYLPDAEIIHYKGKGVAAAKKTFNPEYYKSMFRYFIKNRSFAKTIALWIIIFLNQMVYCCLTSLKVLSGKDNPAKLRQDLYLLFSFICPKEEF